MLTGYNTDVKFADKTYHVQTEDREGDDPIFESLVYVQGQILDAYRTRYANLVEKGFDQEALASVLEAQHNRVMRWIKNGRYDPEFVRPFGEGIISERSFDEVVLGFLGSGVPAALQTWIHENNSSVVPQGWDNEISAGGEPTILLRAQYERRLTACWSGGCGHPELYGRRFFEATMFGEGMVGYYGNVAGGLRARIGWFQSEFWDFDGAPLGSVAQAAGVPEKEGFRNRFEIFAFGGVQGRLVAWNALLQGQFKSNPYEIAASDVKRALGEFQVGLVTSIPLGQTWRVGLGWLYAGRSAEFDGPLARTHTYGSAFLTVTKIPKI